MKRAIEASRAAKDCMTSLQPTFGDSDRLLERMRSLTNTTLILEIRRDSILKDAMNQLWRRDLSELRRPLRVQLGIDEGEVGFDQGGVQQEFFRLAMAEAFNPDYALFTLDSTSKMYWFQPRSLEPLYKYELLGLLTSLAVYNGLTLPFTFPTVFYAKLLGLPLLDLEEYADGWPEMTAGLLEIRHWEEGDVEEDFGLDFTFEIPPLAPHVNGELGKTITVNLIDLINSADLLHDPQYEGLTKAREAGDSKPPNVTNENRELYIQAKIRALTEVTIAPQFEAFRKGFFTLISPKSLSLFTCGPGLLKLLIEGEPTSNTTAAELKGQCTYDGFTTESETVRFFWDVVENEYNPNMLGKLLEFVTSSPRVPLSGNGRITFVLQRNGDDETRMPMSATCTSTLLLPGYKSKRVLREKLKIALENSQGFGMA